MDLKVVSKQVGDRQAWLKNLKALSRRRNDDTLVLVNGQSRDWTPHDLRRTGATIMYALGVSLDVIDRCQNHVLAGSRVRRPTSITIMPREEASLEPVGRSTQRRVVLNLRAPLACAEIKRLTKRRDLAVAAIQERMGDSQTNPGADFAPPSAPYSFYANS